MEILEKLFKPRENKTDPQPEILAELTIFVTMAYIIFVNPTILIQHRDGFWNCDGCDLRLYSNRNPDMGLWANYPFAMAPGMGLNAFFAFTMILGLNISW